MIADIALGTIFHILSYVLSKFPVRKNPTVVLKRCLSVNAIQISDAIVFPFLYGGFCSNEPLDLFLLLLTVFHRNFLSFCYISHMFFQFRLSSSIASNKRSLRPQRKQRSAANPLKTLQKRDDLINEEDIESAAKVFALFTFYSNCRP